MSAMLTDVARHLNEEQNSRQPLFKLPPELLRQIVNEVLPWSVHEVSDRYKNPVWRSTARATEALLPISHTCRWLRQLIIEDSKLWRSIANQNPHFIEMSLSRSGLTGTLTLTLSPPGNLSWVSSADFRRWSYLVPRLQELHLLSCVQDVPQASRWKAFLELPLPQLQYFSWTSLTHKPWNDRDDIILSFSGRNVPTLRYLHLEMVLMSPPESRLPHLTHLSLWDVIGANFETITSVLRNCPALASLILGRVSLSRVPFLSAKAAIHLAMNTVDPPSLPNLSRVTFVDMRWHIVQYFASLFSRQGHPCIQIFPSDLGELYPVEVLENLYLQCAEVSGKPEADGLRLSIAMNTYQESAQYAVVGLHCTCLSVMLADSTRLVRTALCPKLLVNRFCEDYRGKWRTSVLAPLRTLPGLREVWLVDMDTDTDMHSSYAPLWNLLPRDGRQEPAVQFPWLESAVIVYDCSAPLRRLHTGDRTGSGHGDSDVYGPGGRIQPSISALPRTRAGWGLEPLTSVAPNLARVRLAIGYDPDDLPRLGLCEAWQSAHPTAHGQAAGAYCEPGRVELCAKLLREIASFEYAYVRQARLVVQLMPYSLLAVL